MTVRHAILGLLEQRPRHGYELRAAFTAMVGGETNWEVKPAQIYATLARLEQDGLCFRQSVERRGGPDKHVYAITPAGREELRTWLAEPVRTNHRRDEFFLKLMLALATGAGDPLKLIYAQRASLYQELHQLGLERLKVDPTLSLAHLLLLDQAAAHVEADLRWLDVVEARLDEVRRQPLPRPEARPRGRPPKQPKQRSGTEAERRTKPPEVRDDGHCRDA